MKTVYVVVEITGAHDPAPVWAICTTRDIAEKHIATLKEEEHDSIFEINETELDKMDNKRWVN